jgi:polyisoprenoid-binding protein YceI
VLALLTPLLSRAAFPSLWAAVPAAIALAIGFGLAAHNQSNGRLSLSSAKKPAPGGGLGRLQPGAAIRANNVAGVPFQVVPDQSKATYTVQEQLSYLQLPDNAVGSTSALAGMIYLDGHPSTVTLDLKTFKSDQAARDRRIDQESPGFNNYPPARFTVAKMSDLPLRYASGQTVARDLSGTLELNGIEKPWTFAVQARLDGNTLFVHGSTDLTWEDFQMSLPKSPSLVHVDDKIHVEVLLTAKAER